MKIDWNLTPLQTSLGTIADILVIVIFLFVSLYFGYRVGKKTKSMKQFCVGDFSYSIPVMTCTITATMVGAGSTFGCTEGIVQFGVIAAITFAIVESFTKFLTAWLFAKPMSKHRNKLTIGEVIHFFYGRPSRIATGFFSVAYCMGAVAVQIFAMKSLFGYFLDWDPTLCTIVSCTILVLYTGLGGVRSVTITDVIQFIFLIGGFIMIGDLIILSLGTIPEIIQKVPEKYLDPFPSKELVMTWLVTYLIVGIMPTLDPAISQRMLMTNDVRQIRWAFVLAGLMDYFFYLVIGMIAFAAIALGCPAEPSEALPWVLKTVIPSGFKGIAVAGILAVLMSTADSYLNAAAICLVHDFIQPLRGKAFNDPKELGMARWATFILGFGIIWVVLQFTNIMAVLFHLFSFWMPTVVIPLYAGLGGVRSLPRSFLVAALAGCLVSLAWIAFPLKALTGWESIWPAMAANGLVFYVMHNFLGGKNIPREELEGHEPARAAA